MRLNILYSADDKYAKYCGISIISLLENNREIKEIFIYIIDNNISIGNKTKLSKIINDYNRELIFINGENITLKSEKKDDFPVAAYGRLFISDLIEAGKVLYIDCDTIIEGSLIELWEIDIENKLVAGVQDNPAFYNVDIIGMNNEDRYLNSGVLLINLTLWRELDIENEFIEFIRKYNGEVPHHDQGIINGVCRDKIYILNPCYNLMPQMFYFSSEQIMKLYDIKNYYSQEQLDSAVENPVIIHFIEKFYNRPWNKGCTHPLKNKYEKYLELSPWDNEFLENPLNIKVIIRKKIFEFFPFKSYYFIERILDMKRRKYINEKYKFLKMKH